MVQVTKEPLNKQAYDRLLDMIVSGELAHGAQLDERELAQRTGVSRTPLREAIARLAKEGVVEYFPYRGNFIRTWTVKQVNDLYAVRRALESLAVRLAVPKLSDEDIEYIETILDDVERALHASDMEAFGEADRRFHNTIIGKTGNEPLMSLLEQLSVQIRVIRNFANRDPHVVERTSHERPQIVAALKARDADRAASLMEEHIDGVRQAVITQLEAR